MIEQPVWREGLSDPDYERIENKVHNIIIHHSAGSNVDTNYTGIVRNIYIYHTEIRGWSDIGYNYLVAPDGSIFKGRDPANLDQDNVMGAHFCNNNSGTMGICILGTYTDIHPTSEAITSLVALLNWKLGKDSLNPEGKYPHPLNSALPVIAGHRDGCSTECPGGFLYEMLDSLRQEVLKVFQACGHTAKYVSGLQGNEVSGLILSYSAEFVSIRCPGGLIQQFQLVDLQGRQINLYSQSYSSQEVLLSLKHLTSGIYIIKIFSQGNLYTEKIMCM